MGYIKQLFFVIICFLCFSINSLAQTSETFDIATFQSPNGWKKQIKEGVIFLNTSNPQKGTYAIITLYRSGESSSKAKSDFESDWQQFIAGQLGITGKPEVEPTTTSEGWEKDAAEHVRSGPAFSD